MTKPATEAAFLDFLRSIGLAPKFAAEIIADDVWRNFSVEQDRPGRPHGRYILRAGLQPLGCVYDRRSGDERVWRGEWAAQDGWDLEVRAKQVARRDEERRQREQAAKAATTADRREWERGKLLTAPGGRRA
jgi:hypothetical protein